MNKIEELLEKLCPNGVEYNILNTICNIYDGTHQTPKYKTSGIKFVSVENIQDLYATNKYISEEDYNKYKIKPQKNDILMTRIGKIGKCTVIDSDEPLAYYVSLALLRPNKNVLNSKFLKYYIESRYGSDELLKRTLIKAIPIKINLGDIGKISVPVPPLEIQSEIVRILDKFTELIFLLKAELKARKQQYEYYREKLITDLNGEKYRLKDVVDIYLGLTYTPNYVNNGIKFISAQNISNDYLDLENVKYISQQEYQSITKNAKPKRNDVLFTRVGSNLGHPIIVETDEDLCIFVSLGFLRVKNYSKLLNKYLKHWINTEHFWKQIRKNVHGTAQVNINTGWLKNFEISIPPLQEQNRIVEILDKLEKLCNDRTAGIPAEIEARQKQYEYYRDKLLTFKELNKE